MVNLPLFTTWKAKCPIFKAIVAGFRDKVAIKLPRKIGHLAFQALVSYILSVLFSPDFLNHQLPSDRSLIGFLRGGVVIPLIFPRNP